MKFLKAALLLSLIPAAAAVAQTNEGAGKADANLPFTLTPVASFDLPWRVAFLPDGRMLVTEKIGRIQLVTQDGKKTVLRGVPSVYYQGQNGMHGAYLSPHYATDGMVYLTYVEAGEYGGGLALARAKLNLGEGGPGLQNLEVLWRQLPKGMGGQPGAQIAFAPDGNSLFLTVGDRQRFTPAQDINQPVGKILHFTLDGKPAADNPHAGQAGAMSLPLIDPASDSIAAKTAKVVSTYTYTTPNQTPALTWSEGHRTPYGMAFSPTGELWEVEHGPRGGDELNLIQKGKNYGWPVVSWGNNYNGVAIEKPPSHPDMVGPVVYWDPIVAPGNIMFYSGNAFPQWKGNALTGGLATQSITRFAMDGKGGAKVVNRFAVGKRIRDIEQAPDGSLWALEDDNPGQLFRITPK